MKFIKEIIPYILIILVVVLIRTYIVTPIKVNGQSMYDTLSGDEVMLLMKYNQTIERYDIVVSDLVIDGKKEDVLIKRVYGLPGEKIKCENGLIYINDKKIEDDFGYGKTEDFEEVVLKENEYFILGDNREISLDSHIFGPVTKENIQGVTNFVIWPLNKIGKVK